MRWEKDRGQLHYGEEKLRDEGLPDGGRLLPRKRREGRTMGMWSAVSHDIIIGPCQLESEHHAAAKKHRETQSVPDSLPGVTVSVNGVR